jgi:hypothetical protein
LDYVSYVFWHKTSALGFWLLAFGFQLLILLRIDPS